MNANYKIAIVTPYGAEPRLDHFAEFILARGLIAHGLDVRFYTYKQNSKPYNKNFVYLGVKVFRCRQRVGISPGLFFSILRFHPHYVLYFHPKSLLSFTAYLAAKATGAKTVSEIVGILHDPFIVGDTDNPVATINKNAMLITSWKELFRSLGQSKLSGKWLNFITHMPIAKSDAIVAISRAEQNYIRQFYGRESELIHWAIPQAEERPQQKPAEEKYGRLPEKFLLFIAQIKKRKGWDTVLEALSLLAKYGLKKNLVFVSPSTDFSVAKNYAAELGVEHQIYFLSNISNEEKRWLYAHSEVVLALSRYEEFGLPVFEAMAAGRPILTTDIAIYRELLTHGHDCLLSPAGSGKGLAENIKILDQNPALVAKLIQGGQKTIAKYTADIMVNKFIKLIELLLAKEG